MDGRFVFSKALLYATTNLVQGEHTEAKPICLTSLISSNSRPVDRGPDHPCTHGAISLLRRYLPQSKQLD